MKVYKVYASEFGCNSYILTADNKNAVIIDCADENVYYKCLEKGLEPKAVLLTHGHFDHVGGCGKFFEKGVPIYCGEREKDFIFSAENKGIFGGVHIPDFEIAGVFSDGEEVGFCGIKFKVLHTAGHTKGGVCYLSDGCLFSGDTLFCGGVGRCDLPTGSYFELKKSLKRLFSLNKDYKVYCGHGEDTTLSAERNFNPYI